MKSLLLLALVGSAIGFVSPIYAQVTIDPKIDQQIRALAANYDAAFNKNDATAVAALYTEYGAHGWHGTSHDRQAIEKSYARDFQSWHPRSRFTTIVG